MIFETEAGISQKIFEKRDEESHQMLFENDVEKFMSSKVKAWRLSPTMLGYLEKCFRRGFVSNKKKEKKHTRTHMYIYILFINSNLVLRWSGVDGVDWVCDCSCFRFSEWLPLFNYSFVHVDLLLLRNVRIHS